MQITYGNGLDNVLQYGILISSVIVTISNDPKNALTYVTILLFSLLQFGICMLITCGGISIIYSGILGYTVIRSKKRNTRASVVFLIISCCLFVLANLFSFRYIINSSGLTLIAHVAAFFLGFAFGFLPPVPSDS